MASSTMLSLTSASPTAAFSLQDKCKVNSLIYCASRISLTYVLLPPVPLEINSLSGLILVDIFVVHTVIFVVHTVNWISGLTFGFEEEW